MALWTGAVVYPAFVGIVLVLPGTDAGALAFTTNVGKVRV